MSGRGRALLCAAVAGLARQILAVRIGSQEVAEIPRKIATQASKHLWPQHEGGDGATDGEAITTNMNEDTKMRNAFEMQHMDRSDDWDVWRGFPIVGGSCSASALRERTSRILASHGCDRRRRELATCMAAMLDHMEKIGDDSMSALVYPPQHQQAAVADAFGSSLQTALMSDDCRRMGNFFGRSETCAMPEDAEWLARCVPTVTMLRDKIMMLAAMWNPIAQKQQRQKTLVRMALAVSWISQPAMERLVDVSRWVASSAIVHLCAEEPRMMRFCMVLLSRSFPAAEHHLVHAMQTSMKYYSARCQALYGGGPECTAVAQTLESACMQQRQVWASPRSEKVWALLCKEWLWHHSVALPISAPPAADCQGGVVGIRAHAVKSTMTTFVEQDGLVTCIEPTLRVFKLAAEALIAEALLLVGKDGATLDKAVHGKAWMAKAARVPFPCGGLRASTALLPGASLREPLERCVPYLESVWHAVLPREPEMAAGEPGDLAGLRTAEHMADLARRIAAIAAVLPEVGAQVLATGLLSELSILRALCSPLLPEACFAIIESPASVAFHHRAMGELMEIVQKRCLEPTSTDISACTRFLDLLVSRCSTQTFRRSFASECDRWLSAIGPASPPVDAMAFLTGNWPPRPDFQAFARSPEPRHSADDANYRAVSP